MKENKKFIESISRMIKSKKINLGLDSSIVEIKGLQKYVDFDSVDVPKSFNPKTIFNTFATNKLSSFQVDLYDYKKLEKVLYIFDKMAMEVSKKVASDMNSLLEKENPEQEINNYIANYTDFKNIKVSFFNKDDVEEKALSLIEEVFLKLKKSNLNYILVENTNENAGVKSFYGILDSRLKPSIIGDWKRRYSRDIKISVRDFILLVSIGRIVKDCCTYFLSDIGRAKNLLEKIYPNRIFKDDMSVEDVIAKLNSPYICGIIEQSEGLRIPLPLVEFLNTCMSEIVKEVAIVVEYEKSMKSINTSYAKPFMTKKNITKKAQGFMDDNNFLEMFGYVEIDNDCDLDKLKILQDEFIELSKILPLPVSKDNSLRFRRLGNIKASGVYYPMFNALCVDLDGISSFIHEMFHMIDYKEELLSLNLDFKKIVTKYTNLVSEKISSLDKNDGIYLSWNSSKKYNKNYYLNNKEIFARMGEIYVSKVLNIKSSFVSRDFNKNKMEELCYSVDDELLSLIKEYYDNLFKSIASRYDIVNFSSNLDDELLDKNSNSEMSKNFDLGLNIKYCSSEQISFSI